jgi:hypothetical protein
MNIQHMPMHQCVSTSIHQPVMELVPFLVHDIHHDVDEMNHEDHVSSQRECKVCLVNFVSIPGSKFIEHFRVNLD